MTYERKIDIMVAAFCAAQGDRGEAWEAGIRKGLIDGFLRIRRLEMAEGAAEARCCFFPVERIQEGFGIWNSGGYELPETLERLAGLVDIFLPDFKYASRVLAKQYSDAPDYPEVAAAALRTMYRLVGDAQFGPDGMMKKGIIVRHLVLPGGRRDSQEVLHCIAETVPVSGIRLSLMSQYTPEFAMQCPYPELHRRVTTFEYESVVKEAERLGFDGYFQRRSSADACYTPPFEGTVRVTCKTDRGNPAQKV